MTTAAVTVAADVGDQASIAQVPGVEVVPGNSLFGNRYTRAYKLKVLRETDACTAPGELGKYMSRAGLTHTTLTCFRRQRAAGTLDAPEPARKAPIKKVEQSAEQTRRLVELERENRKLKRQLEQAEAILAVQKKLHGCWRYR